MAKLTNEELTALLDFVDKIKSGEVEVDLSFLKQKEVFQSVVEGLVRNTIQGLVKSVGEKEKEIEELAKINLLLEQELHNLQQNAFAEIQKAYDHLGTALTLVRNSYEKKL